MAYCTRVHITDLLLAAYVEKAEAMNEGLVERTIAAVSGEIYATLSWRYVMPSPVSASESEIPELIRYIATVIAAYRIVQAITSLVDTEASSSNEWIPLQQQWKRVMAQLDDLVKGTLRLPADIEERNSDYEEPSMAVVTRAPLFDRRGF